MVSPTVREPYTSPALAGSKVTLLLAITAALSVPIILGACGDGRDGAASQGGAPPDTTPPRSATAEFDSLAALSSYTGLWTAPLLAKRLTEQGMAVTITDSVIRYEHLSVPGQYLKLGRGDLHAFFYPDTASARADAARLDPLTGAPPGVVVNWPAAPTVAHSLNLVVIFLSNYGGHSERVANGILGGLVPPEIKK